MNPQTPTSPQGPVPIAPAPQPQQPPAMTPQPAPGPVAQEPIPAKKSKKGLIIGVIVAAIVVLAAAGYGLYAMVANSPENLLLQAVDNMSREKTITGKLAVTEGANGTPHNGDFGFTYDSANNKNWQLVGGLDYEGTRADVRAINLDTSLFIKVAGLEKLISMSSQAADDAEQLLPLFQGINDKWFELSQSEAESFGDSFGTPSVGVPSSEDLNKALAIYRRHPFIVADKTYADETIEGKNSAHFSIKLDRTRYEAFMNALKAENLSTIPVTDEEIAQAKQADERMKDGVIEVWIARDAKKFTQLSVIGTKPGEESKITLTFTGNAPNFEKFERPQDAGSLIELITSLFLGGSALQETEASEIESDLNAELNSLQ